MAVVNSFLHALCALWKAVSFTWFDMCWVRLSPVAKCGLKNIGNDVGRCLSLVSCLFLVHSL
jgi:hypothetical protein